jgi:hypothetical protein
MGGITDAMVLARGHIAVDTESTFERIDEFDTPQTRSHGFGIEI